MELHRITDLKDLALYTPLLLDLHEVLDGKWEPELSPHEFLSTLISRFDENAFYFAGKDESKLIYFAALFPQGGDKGLFWLFYMNNEFRDQTKIILHKLKDFMKARGITQIYTQSTRTASSYERWLNKFGANKVAIVYKFDLNKS